MEQSDGEVFEDFVSDEVRPSLRSGEMLRLPDLNEGEPDRHPDYGSLRDDGADWRPEVENPNQGLAGDEEPVRDFRRPTSGRALAQRTADTMSVDNEPPYQRLGHPFAGHDETVERIRQEGAVGDGPPLRTFTTEVRDNPASAGSKGTAAVERG